MRIVTIYPRASIHCHADDEFSALDFSCSKATIHFFTGINRVRRADAITKRNVGTTQHIEAMMEMKIDETTIGIFHCTIRTNLDVTILCGSMGREGRLFRTIRFDNTNITCGRTLSVVALTSDPTNEAVEPWRIEAMAQSDYAVLLSTPGNPVCGQWNLTLPPPERLDGRRFRLVIAAKSVADQKIHCTMNNHFESGKWFMKTRPICRPEKR
jgi:hypothetical protein